MSKVKVEMELDPLDVKAANEMMDELINVDYFGKISYDCFLLLEKFLYAVRKGEENNKIKEKIAQNHNSWEWRNRRCQCGHISDSHALCGTTLCILEGCRCEEFKEKQ